LIVAGAVPNPSTDYITSHIAAGDKRDSNKTGKYKTPTTKMGEVGERLSYFSKKVEMESGKGGSFEQLSDLKLIDFAEQKFSKVPRCPLTIMYSTQ
jgi:hypothetical protein